MIVYGIKNCDTVKKARAFLDAAGVAYRFHDYKKDGVDPEVLRQVTETFGWEQVLNRRGTTWRKLPEEEQAGVRDAASALALMLAQPSVIKRPIVVAARRTLLGFDPVSWETALEMGEFA
ncbi:ArsC family reductase [Microvirga tunisiensis]|uniref:ArsC family reductase n=2 Tax=Pannonibacter tanglangensis TaxID=2750084 RepID=A0A7X5F6C4_9HYPH|nr:MULTISPECIES: ArsC family reductase [unclassified Pannonibacter]NBN65378.1 ArsC family reductase [Pannonibacter sp. XCT-34]NBN79645.1 ArsC family reductase [Pannonibacter sp. XCT-53]